MPPYKADQTQLAFQSERSRQFLTTREAAELLGLSPGTLATWRVRRSDGPPFIRVGGRAIRYERGELEAWLAERRRTSTAGSR